MESKFERIMIKLSGESLANQGELGINFDYILEICKSIKEVHDLGVQIGITVGGGNYWRGRSNARMNSLKADHIGMIMTIANALALGDAFEQIDTPVRVQSAISVRQICEDLIPLRSIRHYEKGRIVIFGAGTGRTNCSTDSGAALNAVETGCDVIIKLTGDVDGVYSEDPKKNSHAVRYRNINLHEAISNPKITVMDDKAMSDIRQVYIQYGKDIPIIVANLEPKDNLLKIARGEVIGTFVGNTVETEFYGKEEAKFTLAKRLNTKI